MIRRPPRSALDRSSAASDVYKRQEQATGADLEALAATRTGLSLVELQLERAARGWLAVSYTHLRAHGTVLDIVCRLLLEKKKQRHNPNGRRNEME